MIVFLTSCVTPWTSARMTYEKDKMKGLLHASYNVQYDLINSNGMTADMVKHREAVAFTAMQPAIQNWCDGYLSGMNEAYREMMATLETSPRLDTAPLQEFVHKSRALDEKFSAEIRPLGVTGYNCVKLKSGEILRIPQYVQKLCNQLNLMTDLGQQGLAEKNTSRATLAVVCAGLSAGVASVPPPPVQTQIPVQQTVLVPSLPAPDLPPLPLVKASGVPPPLPPPVRNPVFDNVSGYRKADGTYVNPYVRTLP